jgi:hypothetical protein
VAHADLQRASLPAAAYAVIDSGTAMQEDARWRRQVVDLGTTRAEEAGNGEGDECLHISGGERRRRPGR